ncbi:hypothetical protein DPMN_058789 [Dreissena polymorpha]|uniref:Choline/carnitine acyltransferase domain-containing protein n=1 Tax=Dreissena polymorpha TaxID=45954 RepID=A0A9D4HFV9_DREPO|nr:hypothetical protein DPMN_058789 [Dreissena polymorpha]
MEGAQINIKKFNAKRKMKIHSGMDQKNMDVDALFTSDSEKTFQYDSSLPSLPVPSLQHTLDRYLDSVRPHITDSEFMQTEILVQQFASGVGKDLHKQLVKRASINRNWACLSSIVLCLRTVIVVLCEKSYMCILKYIE